MKTAEDMPAGRVSRVWISEGTCMGKFTMDRGRVRPEGSWMRVRVGRDQVVAPATCRRPF